MAPPAIGGAPGVVFVRLLLWVTVAGGPEVGTTVQDNGDSARCESKLLRWAISWCPREFLGIVHPMQLWPICGQNSQHATDNEW